MDRNELSDQIFDKLVGMDYPDKLKDEDIDYAEVDAKKGTIYLEVKGVPFLMQIFRVPKIEREE